MPLVDLQRRFRELGRIRMGKQVASGRGKRPTKLKTFRLTSASKHLLEAAAQVYGGEVTEWKDAPSEGEFFELLTETDRLRILIPPGEAQFSQWWELWSGGGCKKRCDGRRQILRDVACSCSEEVTERIADPAQCSPATRVSVILPDVPDLGVWRLESHGYNAAVELAGTFDICQIATREGRMVPAHLRIDQRTMKKEGEKRRNFIVPVIELDSTIPQVIEALKGGGDLGELNLPVERKSLPGESPVLSTDEEIEEPVEVQVPIGSVEQGTFAGEPPEIPADDERGPLAKWIMDLPGEDPDVIDLANALLEARKATRRIRFLRDLEGVPEDFKAELIEAAKAAVEERSKADV